MDEVVLKKLELPAIGRPDMGRWNDFMDRLQTPKSQVEIGLIGNYVELKDS